MWTVTVVFAICLIFFLLFSPIVYRVYADGRTSIRAGLSVSWIGRICSVRIEYERGKPLFKEMYLLFRLRSGAARNYDEWLARAVKSEVAEEDSEISAGDDLDDVTEEQAKKASESPAVRPEIGRLLIAIKPHLTDGELYRELLRFFRRIYLHSKPREFALEGSFGLGNPFAAGVLVGAVYAVWPRIMRDVEINYIAPSHHGHGYMKGRIYPFVVIRYVIGLVLSAPMRRLLKTIYSLRVKE